MTSIPSAILLAHILPVRQREFAPPIWRRLPYRLLRLVGRTDTASAAVIDTAVAHAIDARNQDAVDYLCAQRIPLRTIARVLFKPELRRGGTTTGARPDQGPFQ